MNKFIRNIFLIFALIFYQGIALAAVNPSSLGGPKPQYVDLAGAPASGYQIFWYVSGSTSTKQNTYTDATGLVANTNPIVLNTLGEPASGIFFQAGLTYKAVFASPTDTDPPTSPIWTIDGIKGINDTTVNQSQWVAGPAPTFVSATSFTLAGDQTSTYQAGDRLLIVDGIGTKYATISTSVYNGVSLTTVTTINDGGLSLSSPLSAVSIGLLSSTNISIPRFIQPGTNVTITYDSSGRPVINNSLVAAITAPNDIVNGSFAVNQRVTPPTTDNTAFVDMVRLMLGAANAATIVQDTADVPVGAGYALKLIVGSGNNNKFGIFMPIENANTLKYRGNVASIRVPLKATAALTNIKIGILQWTSTADAIAATPISAWGAAGTNPTLIANWTYANTPVTQSVTTAWADYTVVNVSISASATNMGVFVWSDDKTNTQTTDIMRVGGYVTMTPGATAPNAQVAKFADELRNCQRYYFKTFPQSVAPAQSAGVAGALAANVALNGGSWGEIAWPVLMRGTPTITTYNPSVANANWRDVLNSVDRTWVTPNDVNERHLGIGATGGATGANTVIHMIAVDATFQP